MRVRRRHFVDKEAIEDADHSLRAASRLFPGALTPFVVTDNETVNYVEWTETQVASRQRRLDRTLLVRMATGESRWLHLEWTDRLNRRVRERVAEYHWELSGVAMHDARTRRKCGDEKAQSVGIESVVVVLSGRKKPWQKFGVYRSSPKCKKFSGVKFRIEAVYQKTVAELAAMGSVFWLVFVPLAQDVDQEKLRSVVKELRGKVDDDEFVELGATMLSMAKLKKGVPGIVDMVRSAVKEDVTVRSFEFMRISEIERIKANVREEGREEGLEKGLEKRLALVVFQFERRLQRALTENERRRLNNRLSKDGPEKIGAVVLDFSRNQLDKWLAPRKTATKNRSSRRGSAASP